MRVFVTGGTGFVGPSILDAILARGHRVTALVHRQPPPARPGLSTAKGDVARGELPDLAGHDAVVHLVGIIDEKPSKGLTFERLHVEATRHVVEAAKRVGIRRFLHMSANGADLALTPYQRTKLAAEQVVKDAGLDATIFRPSFIAGPGEGFHAKLAPVIRYAPVVPVLGGGSAVMQPVAAGDVGLAFAKALDEPVAVGKTYCVAGPETLTFRQYLERLAKLMGRKRAYAPVPEGLALAMAKLPGFPATPDQLRMLFAGNACADARWAEDLGITPTPWEAAMTDLR
ncbi:MAG TPA: complex I NDUFA9 subunit family protein [Candidatus Thermoplasmatota archaeon]|nr:complex I NDUFA9 subunit family protein [Candidatus Thermoplasmatota archaeon]